MCPRGALHDVQGDNLRVCVINASTGTPNPTTRYAKKFKVCSLQILQIATMLFANVHHAAFSPLEA